MYSELKYAICTKFNNIGNTKEWSHIVSKCVVHWYFNLVSWTFVLRAQHVILQFTLLLTLCREVHDETLPVRRSILGTRLVTPHEGFIISCVLMPEVRQLLVKVLSSCVVSQQKINNCPSILQALWWDHHLFGPKVMYVKWYLFSDYLQYTIHSCSQNWGR